MLQHALLGLQPRSDVEGGRQTRTQTEVAREPYPGYGGWAHMMGCARGQPSKDETAVILGCLRVLARAVDQHESMTIP